jgi:hypothetical protein
MKAPVLVFIDGKCWFVGNVAVDEEMYQFSKRLDLFTTWCPGVTFEIFRVIKGWV